MSEHNSQNCSECGAKLVQRADDTAEIAKSRYQDYIQKTFPILEFYRELKGFHKLDAEKPIMEVFDEICEIMLKTGMDLSSKYRETSSDRCLWNRMSTRGNSCGDHEYQSLFRN
jgi:hypothetical protein